MPITPQDWRVTAQQEVERTVQHITQARSRADADLTDVLRECWLAFQASGAAVGSWTQGLLADGRSWDDIATVLGLSAEQAERDLAPLIAQGRQRLQKRLPSASADDREGHGAGDGR